jgi:hypothetical protein
MGERDDRLLGVAAFLAQALALPDEPTALAADLSLVDADPAVAVYAAELESSIGPAAFLVYAYALAASDEAGGTGETRFGDDLATLQRAADLDAPGPRAVAHARTDTAAYILATSPATLRALTGDNAATVPVSSKPPDPRSPSDLTEARRTAAAELLRLLRAANEQAVVWSLAGGTATAAPLSPEETELALFLLDEDSIKPLLSVLDALLTAARSRTPVNNDQPPPSA